jgi:hypothetical protein
VNFQTDKANCGKCGHDCLYGTCSAGKCQPWVLGSTSGFGTPSIDADSKYVVWNDNGTVRQVPVSGVGGSSLSPTVFIQPANGPVLKNGIVCWNAGATYYTVPEGQTTPTAHSGVPISTYTITELALNPSATIAFFSGQQSSAPNQDFLIQCPLGSTGCGPLGGAVASPGPTGAYNMRPLLVTSTYAFWGYIAAPTFSLNRMTLATNALTTLTTGSSNFIPMVIDANNIYWSGPPGYTVYSVPQTFTSSTTPTTVVNSPNYVEGLASDGTYVYFGTSVVSTGPGSVSYVPVGGGT